MSFPNRPDHFNDSGWGALKCASSSEESDDDYYDEDIEVDVDQNGMATIAGTNESVHDLASLVSSVPSNSTAPVSQVTTDTAQLMALNYAYLDIVANLIERVERAKEQNRAAQHLVMEQINKRKNSASAGNSDFPYTPHLLFLPPYFKNNFGMVPIPNEEAKRRRDNNIYDPVMKLSQFAWSSTDHKVLHNAVREELINARLEPLLKRQSFLQDNIRHNVIGIDPAHREEWLNQLKEVILKIEHTKGLPDVEIFQSSYEGVNFAKIATVNFKGARSELECKFKWLNELSPRWSKKPWSKEEVDELRKITENSFLSWDVVSAKLGTNRTAFQCFQKYQTEVIFNDRYTKPWTVEEDEKLKSLVDTLQTKDYKNIPFKKVATFLEGRTERQVQRRYQTIMALDRKTGRWTEEEDCYLLSAVDKYGEKNWDMVAKEVKGRLANQCRERYTNMLHKGVKHTDWTLVEDEKLLYLSGIFKRPNEARFFITGRTSTMCRNRLKMLLRLKIRRCVAEVCQRDSTSGVRLEPEITSNGILKQSGDQVLRSMEWRKRCFPDEINSSYECISEFVKAEQTGAQRKRRLEARLGLGGNVVTEDGCEDLRPAPKYYITQTGRKIPLNRTFNNRPNDWSGDYSSNQFHPFQSMPEADQRKLMEALDGIDKKYEDQGDCNLDETARAELLHQLVHDYIDSESGVYEKMKISLQPSNEEIAARNRRRLNRRDYNCIAIPKDIPEPDRKLIAMNELCRMIAICEKNDTRHYYRINRVNVEAAASAKEQLKAVLIDNVQAFVPDAARVEPVSRKAVKEYLHTGGNALPPCVPSINTYYNFTTKYRDLFQKQVQTLFTPFNKDGLITNEEDVPNSQTFIRNNIRLSEDIVNTTAYQSLRLRLRAILMAPIIMERAIDTEENRQHYRDLAAAWDGLSADEAASAPVNMSGEERESLAVQPENEGEDGQSSSDGTNTQSEPSTSSEQPIIDCNSLIANELIRLSNTNEEMTLSDVVSKMKKRVPRKSYKKCEPSTSKDTNKNGEKSKAAEEADRDEDETQIQSAASAEERSRRIEETINSVVERTAARKAFVSHRDGGLFAAVWCIRWITVISVVAVAQHEVKVGLVIDHSKLADAQGFFERSAAQIQADNIANYKLRVLTDGQGCGKDKDQGDGAFLAAKMYFKENITSLFGPMCHSDLEITGRLSNQWNIIQFNFWHDHHMDIDLRTVVQMSTSSAVNFANNLAAVLTALNWNKVALFTCGKCYGDEDVATNRYQIVNRVLGVKNMQIVLNYELEYGNLEVNALADILNSTKSLLRIMVPFFGNDLDYYVKFMEAVKIAQLDPEQYITILTVFFDNGDLKIPWMKGGQVDQEIKSYFDRTIVMVNEYYDTPKATEFIKSLPDKDPAAVLGYLQLYESIYVDLMMTDKAYNLSGIPEIFRNGTYVRGLLSNMQLDGPFGPIYLDVNTQRLSPFEVYFVEPKITTPVKFITVDVTMSTESRSGERQIDIVHVSTNMNVTLMVDIPPDMPTCGFSNELCDQSGTIIVIASVMAFVVAAIVMFIIFRKIKSGEAKNMPWALPASSIRNQGDRNASSMLSMGSAQNKGFNQSANDDLRSRELVMADVVPAVAEVYGTKDRIVFDKTDMMLLYQMKQIVHENLNVFIGLVSGKVPEPLRIVWSTGYRGTIENLLLTKKSHEADGNPIMPMDDSIKGAFVRDILKGLIYLHTSPLQYHGALCPAQCFVDQYWVVKLSGFGVYKMLYKWKNNSIVTVNGGRPLIPNVDLHYFAPERRAGMRQFVQSNRFESLCLNEKNGQQFDMYSFGMVLYEILTLKKWCNLSEYVDNGSAEHNNPDEENSFFNDAAEAQIPTQFSVSINDEATKEIHPDLLGIITKCINNPLGQKPNADNAKKIIDSALKTPPSLVDQMLSNMEQYTMHLESLVAERTKQLMEAMEHSTALLREMLPAQVADELRKGNRVAPKYYKQASILYSDIVGFTSMCSESSPMEVVTLLSGLFKRFDQIIADNDCYKVETIGDAYMIASGIPIEKKVENVRDVALVGLGMRDFLRDYEIPHRPGNFLQCRWGINTGPVFTGVIGQNAPRYCVFGATASLAAQMESMGTPGQIQMAFATNQLLTSRFPEFRTQPRPGGLTVQGVGHLLTYWLLGRIDMLVDDDVEDLGSTVKKPAQKATEVDLPMRPASRIDGPMTQTL